MKKILIVDIENTICKTYNYHIKALEKFSKNFNNVKIDFNAIRKTKFDNFYKLYNHVFHQVSFLKRFWVYIKYHKQWKLQIINHYNETFKDNNNVFLMQELKDINNLKSYFVLFIYWNKSTKKFMLTSVFKKNYQININHDNLYKWPFLQESYRPHKLIKDLAKKDFAIENTYFLSNDISLLRFMHALGAKTITVNAKPESLESYIADTNINDLLTDNLLQVLNKLN